MRRTILLMSMVLLTGCASALTATTGGSPANSQAQPQPTGSAKIAATNAYAQSDLARWTQATGGLADTPVLVPTGYDMDLLTQDLFTQRGNWEPAVGNNDKIAMISGQLNLGVTLPTATPKPGTITWAAHGHATVPLMSAAATFAPMATHRYCDGCTPLTITAATLTTETVQASHGPTSVPAWAFSVAGSKVLLVQAAVAPADIASVTPQHWVSSNAPDAGTVDSATLQPDGTLIAHFIGAVGTSSQPCGADYTARTVESDDAVVILIAEHDYQAGDGVQACDSVGANRTATVTLSAPLGNRTVLNYRFGTPIPVTASN